jgi:uncharacterized membrane protein
VALLALGLIVFFVIHLVPTRTQLRANLIERLGRGVYNGLFALIAIAGLALIIVGFAETRGLAGANRQLWAPPVWSRHLAFLLMLPALILLVAAYIPSRIRSVVGHPMLAAIKIWAFAHLLANGDLAGVILFGSFLAYAIFDLVSVKQRAVLGPLGKRQGSITTDVAVIVAGLALYAFMVLIGHRLLIGVSLV